MEPELDRWKPPCLCHPLWHAPLLLLLLPPSLPPLVLLFLLLPPLLPILPRRRRPQVVLRAVRHCMQVLQPAHPRGAVRDFLGVHHVLRRVGGWAGGRQANPAKCVINQA